MNTLLIEEIKGKSKGITTETLVHLRAKNIVLQEKALADLIQEFGEPNRLEEYQNTLKAYFCIEDVDGESLDVAQKQLEIHKESIEAIISKDQEFNVLPVTYTEDLGGHEVLLTVREEQSCAFIGDCSEGLIHFAVLTIENIRENGYKVRDLYHNYKNNCFEVVDAYEDEGIAKLTLLRDGSDYVTSMKGIADLTSDALNEVLRATPESLRKDIKVSFELTTNY